MNERLTLLTDVLRSRDDHAPARGVCMLGWPYQEALIVSRRVRHLSWLALGWSLGVAGLAPPARGLITVGALDEPDLVASDVEIVGTLAYVADEFAGLRIVDVSTPTEPRRLGLMELPARVVDVELSGDIAFVVDASPGLRAIDVSEPGAPIQTGFVALPSIGPLVVSNGRAYVGTRLHGLRILDVSDPAAMTVLGSFPGLNDPQDLEIVGELVYIADDDDGLRVIDVSQADAPIQVGRFDPPGSYSDVAIVGSIAYMTSTFNGLRLVDVSDPTQPFEVGGMDLDWLAQVEIDGSLAYVVEFFPNMVTVVELNGPGALRKLGSIEPPSRARDIEVANGHLYVASSGEGLRIIDASVPEFPTSLGSYFTGRRVDEVDLVEDIAFIGSGFGTLQALDVSDPRAPVELDSLELGDGVRRIVVDGSTAFVAASSAGLQLVDVADPTSIATISSYAPPGLFAMDLQVHEGIVYLLDLSFGLRLIDVSEPIAPVEIAQVDYPFQPLALTLGGGFAYVVGSAGLQVSDVSNPNAPAVVGGLPLPGEGRTADVEEDLLVVGISRQPSLRVIDVADPSAPQEITAFRVGTSGLRLIERRLFLSAGTAVRILDLSAPEAPFELGAFRIEGFVDGIAVDGALVFLANGFEGLTPVDFGPEYAPALSVAVDIRPESEDNPVNPMSHGVLPVAILGSDTFDVTQVDRSSLAFGPAGAAPAHRKGGHPQDVNGDGVTDLLSHYRIEETGIAFLQTEACVSGELLDGTLFSGCDAIDTAPPPSTGWRSRFRRAGDRGGH